MSPLSPAAAVTVAVITMATLSSSPTALILTAAIFVVVAATVTVAALCTTEALIEDIEMDKRVTVNSLARPLYQDYSQDPFLGR
ncbi:riboflavin kinase [Pseudozyma hubeiensis SY62]|uniref:Riboflavin kinase n=1 Tax=Pseudozyma hubeiensis (strain SY62) TaxID=1305764 RepID=R9PIY7_PSEHS|nr:riboflavin kinase [Pseudozyma hubeiensis SY62]GAC98090.1 riboflavin kinase [Pseudozyma hubeiensis SY62]